MLSPRWRESPLFLFAWQVLPHNCIAANAIFCLETLPPLSSHPLLPALLVSPSPVSSPLTHTGRDEASFFFLRGSTAVRAFDRALREIAH